MKNARLVLSFAIVATLSVTVACSSHTAGSAPAPVAGVNRPRPSDPTEPHLRNIRQLTDGGENAEAYFSADGKWITFQSSRNGRTCDQQFVMRADGSDLRRVSNGTGKTTCGWFIPGTNRLFFGSSHMHDSLCPPKPDPSKGYVWPLDKFDIFTVNRDGSGLKRLTTYDVYTAEGVLSPDGKRVVFTSLKGGDLDIYTMNIDGTDVKQLTNTLGYDGGAWWSPDGTKIVYRAHHPKDSLEIAQYKELLAQGLIRPSKVELYVMNADGSDNRQITHLGGANFGPSWTPDGKRIIFASNHKNPRSGNFDLYLVNLDGSNLEQVTTSPVFDGFPMFSADGKQIIWASNRFDQISTETNLFIADWQP
jgi:Tol biopolymer transport system component